MTSKPKAKGNSWERELCVILSEKLDGNWQRVPNSGAFTGGRNVYRKDSMDFNQIRLMKGDIIPPEHMKHIVLECKFYKDFSFHHLVQDENKQLGVWIEQTIESADVDDIWFLCIKINRKGSFVTFDKKLSHHFVLDNHVIYKDFIFTDLLSFFEKNKDKIKELCK